MMTQSTKMTMVMVVKAMKPATTVQSVDSLVISAKPIALKRKQVIYLVYSGIWLRCLEGIAEAMDSEDESDSDDGPGLSDSTMDNSLRSDRENSDMLVDDYERYNYL